MHLLCARYLLVLEDYASAWCNSVTGTNFTCLHHNSKQSGGKGKGGQLNAMFPLPPPPQPPDLPLHKHFPSFCSACMSSKDDPSWQERHLCVLLYVLMCVFVIVGCTAKFFVFLAMCIVNLTLVSPEHTHVCFCCAVPCSASVTCECDKITSGFLHVVVYLTL